MSPQTLFLSSPPPATPPLCSCPHSEFSLSEPILHDWARGGQEGVNEG